MLPIKDIIKENTTSWHEYLNQSVLSKLPFSKIVAEAFSGYEDIAKKAGWVCTTAADFVAAISRAQSLVTQSFDPDLRAIYEEKYSFEAAKSRLANIFG